MTTKTDITQERTAFEAWARYNWYPLQRIDNYDNDYKDDRTQGVWEAWQARAAVEANQPADGQIVEDALIYGIGASIDGKRIAPQDLYMPDRQSRMPSDEEIIAEFANAQTSDGNANNAWTLYPDELVHAVHALLSRYGSGQPAASAEPRPDEYDRFVDWYDKTAPDGSEVRPYDMARQAWLAGVRFADRFPAAAPVAQEPVDFEHRHAIKQGERNGAEDKYFEARPEFDNKQNCRLFCDGFDRGYEAAPVAAQPKVTDEMVTRFLGWHLPQDFAPGAGISFKPLPDPLCWPIGTDLFRDPQARAMLEYVLTGVQK